MSAQNIFDFGIGAIALYAAILNTINLVQWRRWQKEQQRALQVPHITHYRATRNVR